MPAPTARLSLTPRAASDPSPSMEEPGQKLKRMRERLNLRYRDVEEASQKIAEIRGSDEFAIVLSRLADIENKGTVPTIFRLYSLCAIYRLDPVEVLEWYGVDFEGVVIVGAEAHEGRPEGSLVRVFWKPHVKAGYDFRINLVRGLFVSGGAEAE